MKRIQLTSNDCPSCSHNMSRSRCKYAGFRTTKTLIVYQWNIRCNGCKTNFTLESKVKYNKALDFLTGMNEL